jgi:hypothetical protein
LGITVQIKPAVDAKSTVVVAGGSEQHIVTDKERASFGLDDGALKNAIGKYFGKNPNDAYLRGPTPWNDLYKTYNWPQVQTVLMAQSAQILELTSQPSIIKTTTLRNTSRKPGNFSASVNDNVTNTFETNWNVTTSVELSQSVEYSVELAGLGSVGGSTSWSFGLSVGVGGARSQSVSVGSDQGVSADLDPGEAVEAQLTVSRGILKARIFYDVYLIGSTAINYNPTFKGHHFWALDIGQIMQAGGIKNHRQITQDITVGYYSNAEVKLSDHGKMALKAMAAPLAEVA